MPKKILKSFTLTKNDVKPDGTFKCVFATMGVIDKDGDVSMPGFFGSQTAVVVPVHNWANVPIGKARIYEQGNEAIAEGKINLDICEAKDWFSAMQFDLENGEPLMEWSYGFKTLDGGSSTGDFEGQQVRFLKPLPNGSAGCKIYEVSPVMVGAGEGTRTLAAKGMDDGKKLCDEASEVLDAAESLVERAGSLAGLRAKDGRELSAVNKERLALLADSLVKSAKDMVALVAPVAKKKTDEPTAASSALAKEVTRALRIRAGIQA